MIRVGLIENVTLAKVEREVTRYCSGGGGTARSQGGAEPEGRVAGVGVELGESPPLGSQRPL